MSSADPRKAYWRRNLVYLAILLSIWFAVSYGCGILFVEELNQIRMGGFKLGFWFAQQGSIYVFVILIFVYVFLMNRLDKTVAGIGSGSAGAADADADADAGAAAGAAADADADADHQKGGQS